MEKDMKEQPETKRQKSPRYSFSRMDSFKRCRLQYKFRYIDGLRTEVETIEAFMGNQVHEALKDLYNFFRNRVIKPKDWLLSHYEDLWKKNFHSSIKIVRSELSADDYFEKGKKCLTDYYKQYHPFDQTKIVKTEEPMYFTLRHEEEEFPFFGILDRLDWNDKEQRFEIHDYKTSANLITQEEADRDLQLTLYLLALSEKWPEAQNARLIWHFLLFNKEIISSRSEKQLMDIKDITVNKIKEIESCQDFPPCKSVLCDWCDYQDICPLWKHPLQAEKLDANQYLKDPGVQLVSKYAELEEEKKQLKKKIFDIEQEQAKISEAAILLAEKEGLLLIDGPDHQLAVTIKEEMSAPARREDTAKWEALRHLLIREGRYVDVSTVNNNMLNRMIKVWPQEFVEKIKAFLIKKIIKKVDLKTKS
jgi:putative RecB family exonuclease